MKHADIVVVGAGEAGTRTSLALRRLGFTGSLYLAGADPQDPYELPPLSKDFITAPDPIPRKTIASSEDLAKAGILFSPGNAAIAINRVARTVDFADGSTLSYSRMLYATGSSPRDLMIPGIRPTAIHVLRSAAHAKALRARFVKNARIVIVGGGFIGLELAASAIMNGAKVTVVEGLERILKRGVPAEIADVVAARHREAGVDLRTGVSVVAGESLGGHHRLTLSDGSCLDADAIVAGIGAAPNTALASKAGLAVANGVVVDAAFRTSDPAIFAAGDCISFPHPVFDGRYLRLESWRAAVEHGAHVAKCMMGEASVYDTVPWFWSDQYDLVLQVAGLIDEGRSVVRRELGEGAFLLLHLNEVGRLVAASGIGPGNAVARDVRLAEMLIQRRAAPNPAALADPQVKLKSLLQGAPA